MSGKPSPTIAARNAAIVAFLEAGHSHAEAAQLWNVAPNTCSAIWRAAKGTRKARTVTTPPKSCARAARRREQIRGLHGTVPNASIARVIGISPQWVGQIVKGMR